MTKIADEIDREMDELCEQFSDSPLISPMQAVSDIATGKDKHPLLKEAVDRYYLPRPLFEDGEPVEVGDSVELNGYTREVTGLHVSCDGKVTMNMKDGSSLTFDGEIPLLKRPEPQVLDADGVPIEVGDKVWMLPGKHCETFPLYGYKAGVEYTVSENENAIHKEDGRICITGGDCTCGYPMPEQVTHREPDSQERIDADVPKTVCKYFGASGKPCDECPIHGSKIGCSNEKMRDLLRRQRELDGRDA